MRTYFFDLDGTLADSRSGLLAAFRAGIHAAGGPDLADEALQDFIGTPLPAVFRAVGPGFSQAAIESGIAAFRRHYEADGMFQTRLYPNVIAMLNRLCDGGAEAWIVTSKPQSHAVQAVAWLKLQGYITGIVGAGLDETDTKTGLVARALAESGAHPAETIMLGDRHYDVTGARDNNVMPVGALWGYGTRAELAAAGCTAFAESPRAFAADFMVAARVRAAAG